MEEIIKLLLVEDDANLCYIIQGGLEDMIGGYKVLSMCPSCLLPGVCHRKMW